MTEPTKKPNGTYDRFDEHLERGDHVIRDSISGAKREYIFREITADGQVVYCDLFGRKTSTLASTWQREWERGDLEIVGDEEPDLDSYEVVAESSAAKRATKVRDHYRTYDSGSFIAPAGALTTVGGEKVRIDFEKISDDEDLCELTLLVRFDTSVVVGHSAVSKQDWDELMQVSGVEEHHAEALREAGYESIEDLKAADQGELADLGAIGNALAARIKADVGGLEISPFEIEPPEDDDGEGDDLGNLGGVVRGGESTQFPTIPYISRYHTQDDLVPPHTLSLGQMKSRGMGMPPLTDDDVVDFYETLFEKRKGDLIFQDLGGEGPPYESLSEARADLLDDEVDQETDDDDDSKTVAELRKQWHQALSSAFGRSEDDDAR